jgi:hypothetical protein
VQREFSWLVKDDLRVDAGLRAFLSRTYLLIAIAHYLTGPGSNVSTETAREAIQTARRLVECAASLLPPSGQTPGAHITQKAEARRQRAVGATLTELARSYDVSSSTISRPRVASWETCKQIDGRPRIKEMTQVA